MIKEVEVIVQVEVRPGGPVALSTVDPEDLHSFIYTGPAPTTFGEAPILAELVMAGELPPVVERLPKEPLVLPVVDRAGDYGGTWRRGFTGPGDVWNINRPTPAKLLMWDTDEVTIYANMAAGFSASDDDKVFTITLREGMKWSDGAPLTTADIDFGFNHVVTNEEINPGAGGKLGFSSVAPADIEIVDDYTFRFIFDEPTPAFLEDLASGGVDGNFDYSQYGRNIISPKHYMSQFHIDFGDKAEIEQMVKDGGFETWTQLFLAKAHVHQNPDIPVLAPWKMTSPNTGDSWEFERNPYYWAVDPEGNQLPYIDRIQLTLTTAVEVLHLMAMSGEIDYQRRHIELSKLPLLIAARETGNYRLELTPNWRGTGFNFNLTYDEDPEINKWINNVDFRRALALGVDRDSFNQTFFQGLGLNRNASPLSAHPFYLGSEWDTKWNYLDIDQANQMLDDIGLSAKGSDGFRLRTDNGDVLSIEIGCIANYFEDYCGMGELLASQWAEIGIKGVLKGRSVDLYSQLRADNTLISNVGGGPGGREPMAWQCTNRDNCEISNAVGQWNDSDGAEGSPPSGVIKQIIDLNNAAKPLRRADRKQYFQDAFKLQIDSQIGITFQHGAPAFMGVAVIKNNFKNVAPGVGDIVSIPKSHRADQWFFEGGKNDAGY